MNDFGFRGRPVERVSVILEEVRNGVRGALMRYDDAHGVFQQHAPGSPEPGDIVMLVSDPEGVIPARLRAMFADHEIRARYTAWEAEVFGPEGDNPT